LDHLHIEVSTYFEIISDLAISLVASLVTTASSRDWLSKSWSGAHSRNFHGLLFDMMYSALVKTSWRIKGGR